MGSCPDTDIDPGTVWLKFLFFFFYVIHFMP